ncbi:TolC family protein [Fibrobacterales bacterium]|nr:TolC family protein [Fibrobacterales bacterium]
MIKYLNQLVISICWIGSIGSTDLNNLLWAKTHELNLQALTELALQENPLIKASKVSLEISKQKETQVGILPNPTFKYTYFGESVETRVGPQEQKFSLEQRLPWPSKLSNQNKVAIAKSAIADAEIHKKSTSTVLKVRLLWADIQHLKLAQNTTLESISLLKIWLSQLQTSFESSQTPYHRLLKMQNQISQIENDFKQRARSIQNKLASLKAELNIPSQDSLKTDSPKALTSLSLSEGQLDINSATHHNHAVMMARNDKALWQIQKSLNQSEYFPDFSIGFSYIQTGEANSPLVKDSGKDPWSVNLGLSLPIFFSQTKARQKESELGRSRAQINMNSALNTFQNLKTQFMNDLHTEQENQILYQTQILPNLSKSISLQTSMLSTGKINFLELLDAYQMKLEYELKVQSTIKNQFKNKAKLLWLTGDIHPQFNFQFNTSTHKL